MLAFTSLRAGNAALYVSEPRRQPARTGSPRTGRGRLSGRSRPGRPTGTRVVYTCGNFELCVASADGTGAARLTKSAVAGYRWSYDFAARLVARRHSGSSSAGRAAGQSSGLCLVGADGTGLEKAC